MPFAQRFFIGVKLSLTQLGVKSIRIVLLFGASRLRVAIGVVHPGARRTR
jgi:hypothetical protein